MDCFEVSNSSKDDFLARWNQAGHRERVPITGGVALTHRCNLKCIHCYAGPEEHSIANGELPTERWLALLDEMAAAGCVFLLITGGDPLIRPDFAEIYRHAKKAGMMITLFTNGILIDDELLELFGELPPRVVEISIYGATAATHDRITGIEGSFDRLIEKIEKLLERGVRLRMKSILMKPNEPEFADIRSLVEDRYGLEFRMDAAIMPRLDGDMMPLELRVAPRVAVAHEMANPDAVKRWENVRRQSRLLRPSSRLYNCGAGVIGFHVDAEGNLLPCLLTTDVSFDLKEKPFDEGWRYIVETMDGKQAAAGFECHTCENNAMCGWCPSYALLENGDANSLPEYLCELGRHRRAFLDKHAVAQSG